MKMFGAKRRRRHTEAESTPKPMTEIASKVLHDGSVVFPPSQNVQDGSSEYTIVAPHCDSYDVVDERLDDVVPGLRYKPGWGFRLSYGTYKGEVQRFLVVTAATVGNSDHRETLKPGEVYVLEHYFEVPHYGMSRDAWVDWVFQAVLLVERHEAAEFFRHCGVAPFAAPHGDRGANLYDISRKVPTTQPVLPDRSSLHRQER